MANGDAAVWRRFQPLLVFLLALWLVHGLDRALDFALSDQFGLRPREIGGLPGVLAMPFLHADWPHLTANTTSLLGLGALILILAPRRFWPATLITVLLAGALIWVFARPYPHVGASGLVFGWFGFLIVFGLLERTPTALLGAGVAILAFGASTVSGLTPIDERVSWEGHLAGLVAGAGAALWLSRARWRRR